MISSNDQEQNYWNTNDDERKRREIIKLKRNSDYVRSLIDGGTIEQAAKSSASEDIYWFIHKAYFRANPLRVIHADKAESTNWLNNTRIGDIEQHIGQLRSSNVLVGVFECLDVPSLPEVSKTLFAAIDDVIHNAESLNDEQKWRALAIIDSVLTIGHFPFDVSGRTNEDFIVYIAKKIGVHFSISMNGLRGFIDDSAINEAGRIRKKLRVQCVDSLQVIFHEIVLPESQPTKLIDFEDFPSTETLINTYAAEARFTKESPFYQLPEQVIKAQLLKKYHAHLKTLCMQLIDEMQDTDSGMPVNIAEIVSELADYFQSLEDHPYESISDRTAIAISRALKSFMLSTEMPNSTFTQLKGICYQLERALYNLDKSLITIEKKPIPEREMQLFNKMREKIIQELDTQIQDAREKAEQQRLPDYYLEELMAEVDEMKRGIYFGNTIPAE